jgi:hypothetical protein
LSATVEPQSDIEDSESFARHVSVSRERGPAARMPALQSSGVIASLLAIVLLVTACLSPGIAQQPKDSVDIPPLASLLKWNWAADKPWKDGLSEVAEYDASAVEEGRLVRTRRIIVTDLADMNRETGTRASWPYVGKPIVEALRQRDFSLPTAADPGLTAMVDVFADRRNPSRLLRMSISRTQWKGALTRDFDFWRDTPTESWSSPLDTEGAGSRTVDSASIALFEEQLPLVLRGLEFKDGAEGWLTLYRPVSTGDTTAPATSPGVATITRESTMPRFPLRDLGTTPPWRVTIECGDGRKLIYLFSADPAHTMLSFEHSDGRTLAISALGRRVFQE